MKEDRKAPAQSGFGCGGSRGGRFQNRDDGSRNEKGFSGNYGSDRIVEEGDGKAFERCRGYGGPPRHSFDGDRRGKYGGNAAGDAKHDREHPLKRSFEWRSGTGHGYDMKCEGAGRTNRGNVNDDVLATHNFGK